MLSLAISGFINGIAGLVLGGLVFFKNPKRKINQIFGLMSFSVGLWGISYGMWQVSTDREIALFWVKILSIGVILMAPFFHHWVLVLLNIKRKKTLYFGYFISLLCLLSLPFSFFVKTIEPQFDFLWWPKAGFVFILYFFLNYLVLIGYSFYLLFKAYTTERGYKREQIKYTIIGTALGVGGAFTNLPLWFGIPFPPYGTFLVFLYPLILAYAITRYRLMDIRFVLGRGAIYIFSFVSVFALAFSLVFLSNKYLSDIPFNITWSFILVVSILLFPIIFRVFEKLASKYFYYTLYSYQAVLTDLSKRLTEILDLDRLSSLVVNTLKNTMKLDRVVVLLRDPDKGEYKIQKNIGFREENGISLVKDNFLTFWLEKTQRPLVFEELSLIIQDAIDQREKERLEILQANMKRIEASVCLPLFSKGKIIGMIVLGNKISGEPYSVQDIELLINLSSQSAIAFQNARFYKEIQNLSKNLEKRVEEQVKQIRALSEMKTEFLKIVNHQLRTPVSIIKGMSSMLTEGTLSEEKKKDFIKKLYLASERLSVILDDILVAQSLIGSPPRIYLSSCNVKEIIENVIRRFKPLAKSKGLKIILKTPKKPLDIVFADSEIIQRTVARLLDNAILYTEKGQITISFGLTKEKHKQFLQITIKDSGIGLDKKDKENLFRLFYRGQQAVYLHPNGSGLGLFIVKNLIEAHKGEIQVESKGRGKGTRFVVRVPVTSRI